MDCLLCLRPGKIHSTVDVQNGDAQISMLLKSCRELINEELANGVSDFHSRSRRGDDLEIVSDFFGRKNADDEEEEGVLYEDCKDFVYDDPYCK